MRRTRRTGVLAIAASLALTAGTVTAVLPASALDDPIAYESAGTLSLTTSTTAPPTQVNYAGLVQPLATKVGTNCELSTGSDLLKFEGILGSDTSPPKLGFRDGSIGVIETGSAGFCNRVDAVSLNSKSETLVITLAPNLTNFADKPLVAKSASLDLEVRAAPFLLGGAKAKIEITTFLGTDPKPVSSRVVTQGVTTECPVTKDNDNCQVPVTVPEGKYFNKVTLKALKGSFSVEGGSDPQTTSQTTATAPTTFELFSEVDAIFACAPGTELTVGNAVVTGLGDATPTAGECKSFGVVLESEDRLVRFLKPLSISPTAQFVFDVDWKLTPTGAAWSPDLALPKAYIDFELAGGEGEKEMPFCPSYLFDADGKLVGVTDSTTAAEKADLTSRDMEKSLTVPGAAETQFACIGSRNVNAGPAFTITDQIYLIGDAKMRL